jgi:thiol-disulfide isomerase/thioredoxin
MNLILLFARLVLAVVFGASGIAKLADPSGSRKSIAGFGVPESFAKTLAWLLPLAELACAAALVPLASAWWGAAGVLTLLLIFIAGISISLIRGRKPDCHCFGQLSSAPIGWQTLVRNIVLAGFSAWIVGQGREDPGASVVGWLRGVTGTNSAVTGLAIAVAVLALFELWALAHVLRQNGRLLLRLEAVEASVAGGGAVEAPPPGLPVGSDAPAFSLTDLVGDTVTTGMLLERGKTLMLLFSEPGCGACDDALAEISQWQRDYSDRLSIVPISRGGVKENRAKSRKYGLRNVLLQADRETAQAYQAEAAPSAVLVKDGRIESSLAVGVDEIRGLVARATLPPSVSAGDRVPSLRLPDLGGEMIDIADIFQPQSRTLVLFWSPSCGFCQEMLEDLKKWEHDAREDAPELVVISAGALDENRKQGFRSRVLLDPYYAASQVFNSGGTPSAVMVEEGKVASGVAVGAEAVLALAGAVAAGGRRTT